MDRDHMGISVVTVGPVHGVEASDEMLWEVAFGEVLVTRRHEGWL